MGIDHVMARRVPTWNLLSCLVGQGSGDSSAHGLDGDIARRRSAELGCPDRQARPSAATNDPTRDITWQTTIRAFITESVAIVISGNLDHRSASMNETIWPLTYGKVVDRQAWRARAGENRSDDFAGWLSKLRPGLCP